ncbi:MAG: transcriptional regulator [Chitinophagaceae bacterium]
MSTTVRRANPQVITSGKATSVKKQRKTKAVNQLKSKKQIKSKEAYDLTMKEIDVLMKRGEANLSLKELNRLRSMAEAAEIYEDTHDPLPLPESLPEMIRMRMFQMQLTQRFAAKLLGVSEAKFSLIMSRKQKPDVIFIKAIHDKLKVDANRILKAL